MAPPRLGENNTTKVENTKVENTKESNTTNVSNVPEEIKNPVTKTTNERKEALKNGKSDFELLEENTKYNEVLRNFIFILGDYIDGQLKDYSKAQKENIKFVLLADITEKIKNLKILNFQEKIQNSLKSITKIFELYKQDKNNINLNKQDKNNINLNKQKNTIIEAFNKLGIDSIKEDFLDKIEELKKKKEEKENFNKISTAFEKLGVDEIKYNDLETNLGIISNKIDSVEKTYNSVKQTAKKFGFGNIFKKFIDGLKTIPIIGPILMMFFKGLDSKNESNNKKEKSTTNLIKFIQNKNYSPLDEIENKSENTLKEKLKSENLKDFYKYLDSKKIDYSDKNFWSNFLKGENKGGDDIPDNVSKLKKLFDETFKDGDSMQDISLDSFIKKLNGLGKKETQKEVKKTDEKIKKLEAQLKQENSTQKTDKIDNTQSNVQQKTIQKTDKINTQSNVQQKTTQKTDKIDKTQSNVQQNTTQKTDKTNTQKDTNLNNVQKTTTIVSGITKKTSSQKIENNKVNVQKQAEILKRIHNLKFEKSLLEIKSLPADIIDFRDGKNITLDIIDNKKIKLGNNTYTIEINTKNFGDKFEKIEFKNQEFLLNGEKSISKKETITLLRDLINNNKFTFKGSTKKLFMDINYEVVIEKA